MQHYDRPSGPEVTVTHIPLVEAEDKPISIDLGDHGLNAQYSGPLSAMRDRADTAYLLTWQGNNRVPRGIELGSRVIAWTQHGRVVAEDGEQFGIYERIKDVDGSDLESKMLVFTFPEPDTK